MLRKVLCSELDWLYNLAEQFNAAHYDYPLDKAKTRAILKELIRDGVCIRSESGAIVGTLLEDPFRQTTVLVELGWYTNDKSGIRLLKEFVSVGVKLNVDEIRMTLLESSPPAADRYLQRMGFSPFETSYRLIPGD
ncbi:hypothetical protein HOR19_gp35 [Phage MedPE-SWcel-C56]|uniref:Uncharacterized protein n=1 Tax=Phage MedPE-SWcel-C56 TaxID=1871314 RepID=A0A1B1IY30_9CAUD|nr:hypothetical protein HOR19_gp35 [Phage MedPE-SWcel-C56]ANS06228.1 hypothetical protein [Phage MedPE-SWcel-C56]